MPPCHFVYLSEQDVNPRLVTSSSTLNDELHCHSQRRKTCVECSTDFIYRQRIPTMYDYFWQTWHIHLYVWDTSPKLPSRNGFAQSIKSRGRNPLIIATVWLKWIKLKFEKNIGEITFSFWSIPWEYWYIVGFSENFWLDWNHIWHTRLTILFAESIMSPLHRIQSVKLICPSNCQTGFWIDRR